ncbi:MAG: pyridoxamine 5'-phosphate oxidase family protein [Promethearchaeota archaeon]
MRRKNKEITDKSVMEDILKRAQVCRIGLSENDHPYIIPVNFGYENNTLYIHSAPEGKKIEILKSNNEVCFEVETNVELIKNEKNLCRSTMKFRSVIGKGRAEFIQDPKEKENAFHVILCHYYTNQDIPLDDRLLEKTIMIKINILEMTGKKSAI